MNGFDLGICCHHNLGAVGYIDDSGVVADSKHDVARSWRQRFEEPFDQIEFVHCNETRVSGSRLRHSGINRRPAGDLDLSAVARDLIEDTVDVPVRIFGTEHFA